MTVRSCGPHQAKVTGATLVVAKLDRLSRNVAFITALQDARAPFDPGMTVLGRKSCALVLPHKAPSVAMSQDRG
jgi:hypothetical protein